MKAALDQLKAVVGQPTPPPQPETPLPPKPQSKADKFKALEAVEKLLNKQFETTNSIVRLGKLVGKPMPSLPTGLYTFDFEVSQTGGVPDGRIIEIFGPESSGKTTFALQVVAAAQEAGELAAFVDAEHALDPNYASKLGVNVDELLVSQPDSGEQALETVIALIHSRAVRVVVVDSVAALVPQAELDGEMGDSHMGLQARLLSQAMRKIRGIASKAGVTVIFINQIREKLGVMFGNPETTTGGRALKFYSSIRLDVRRVSKTDGGEITSGDVQIGHRMKIKAVKNKVGTPFRQTIVDLIYGVGFDREADMVQYAANLGVIEKKGAWLSYGTYKAQGVDKLKELLVSDRKAMDSLKEEIFKAQAAQREAEVA